MTRTARAGCAHQDGNEDDGPEVRSQMDCYSSRRENTVMAAAMSADVGTAYPASEHADTVTGRLGPPAHDRTATGSALQITLS